MGILPDQQSGEGRGNSGVEGLFVTPTTSDPVYDRVRPKRDSARLLLAQKQGGD